MYSVGSGRVLDPHLGPSLAGIALKVAVCLWMIGRCWEERVRVGTKGESLCPQVGTKGGSPNGD
jgi:hypothetical protein